MKYASQCGKHLQLHHCTRGSGQVEYGRVRNQRRMAITSLGLLITIPSASTTSQITIDQLRMRFVAYGHPEKVVSRNGPQLIASEVVDFLKQNGVKQIVVPPYHSSSNGAAERTLQILKC